MDAILIISLQSEVMIIRRYWYRHSMEKTSSARPRRECNDIGMREQSIAQAPKKRISAPKIRSYHRRRIQEMELVNVRPPQPHSAAIMWR